MKSGVLNMYIEVEDRNLSVNKRSVRRSGREPNFVFEKKEMVEKIFLRQY